MVFVDVETKLAAYGQQEYHSVIFDSSTVRIGYEVELKKLWQNMMKHNLHNVNQASINSDQSESDMMNNTQRSKIYRESVAQFQYNYGLWQPTKS